MNRSGLDRRAVALGIGGLAGLAATHALAQTPLSASENLPVVQTDDEARLIHNLFTRMSTQTSVNGSRQIFVLDTGAGCTAIASDVAAGLELPAGPPLLVHGLTSAEVAPTVHIRRMVFGGRRFTDFNAAVFPRELLAADGLLGLDVLGRFKLDFDLRRRTMRLQPSGPDVIEFGRAFATPTRIRHGEGTIVRRSRFGQLILGNVRADGISVESFIDSGAQYSIGNLALLRAVGQVQGSSVERAMTQVFGVTGQTLFADRRQIDALTISNYPLGPTPLFFADLHAFEALGLSEAPALLIGADLLYRFRRVSLDFGESRVNFSGLRRLDQGR